MLNIAMYFVYAILLFVIVGVSYDMIRFTLRDRTMKKIEKIVREKAKDIKYETFVKSEKHHSLICDGNATPCIALTISHIVDDKRVFIDCRGIDIGIYSIYVISKLLKMDAEEYTNILMDRLVDLTSKGLDPKLAINGLTISERQYDKYLKIIKTPSSNEA